MHSSRFYRTTLNAFHGKNASPHPHSLKITSLLGSWVSKGAGLHLGSKRKHFLQAVGNVAILSLKVQGRQGPVQYCWLWKWAEVGEGEGRADPTDHCIQWDRGFAVWETNRTKSKVYDFLGKRNKEVWMNLWICWKKMMSLNFHKNIKVSFLNLITKDKA